MDSGISPVTGKKEATSAGRFMGWNTIHDKTGSGSPYMTRIWIGRLRFHIFYRGDLDEDCHDHPWDFWTFPLTSYVEEVAVRHSDGLFAKVRQVVPAFRLSFRPATHCHRVIAKYTGPLPRRKFELYEEGRVLHPYDLYGTGKIVTIVWRSKPKRTWGFLKNRDGKWCWIDWRDYVFGNGKSAPCE